ncbi:alpha/beta hydrolase [Candidatus Pacearchaeota archaeon]|nr:alpha/beta hydrolase [Candidatus Pacearchaeota archaeon]
MKKRNIVILLIIILIIGVLYFYFNKNKDPYSFKGTRMYYSEDRGEIDYSMELREENVSYDIYNISFLSKPFRNEETKIYGLLFLPHIAGVDYDISGVIIVPGGGVTKEQRIDISRVIAESGYSVLVIDQRGIGETGGSYLNLDQDFEIFMNGGEPIQHLSVYDVLRSYDVLKEIEGVGDEITLLGESMGGRYSLISAAVDKRINGVIAVSSSGFEMSYDPNNPTSVYMMSIDPDNYIHRISPNPVYFIHTNNDSVISLDSSKNTFDKAREPKEFLMVEDKMCLHGFCEKMYKPIIEVLGEIFE